ncbi:Ig-like domain-containing protein [Alteromonas sp. OM2203]|uniref:Ig-like domain-containing protein n=1 Tax=Alteromonas sp. OM2203 TaxID=3398817 RepID=UPI003AF3738B
MRIASSTQGYGLRFHHSLVWLIASLCVLFGMHSAYAGTPTFSTSFSPSTIAPGGVAKLTYVIDNTANDTPVSNVAFSNTLPSSITLNSPLNVEDNCTGLTTATAGGNSVSYALERLPIGSTCEISVDVTSTTPGTHVNTTGDLTSSGGSSGSASASLTVDSARPNLSIAVSPSSMSPGAVSRLTYIFDNTSNGSEMAALHLDAVLPSGVVISSQPNTTTSCTIIESNGYSGVVVTPGTRNIKLGYFTVAAGASCTASVDITSSIISDYTLNSGVLFNATVQSFGSFTFVQSPVSLGVQDTAQLSVESSLLSISTPNSVVPGVPTTLTFTLLNNNRDQDITNLSFTDDLNAALTGLSATNLPASDFCGAGSSISGTSLLSISNVSLASGESCSFAVNVLIPSNASAGSYTNTSSIIAYDLDGSPTTSIAASNAINIYSAPLLNMQVVDDPVGLGDDVTLRYTVTNTDSANALSDATFQHTLNTLVAGVTINTLPAANSCGTGSTFTGNTDGSGNLNFVMNDGVLAAGGSCSIDVALTMPVSGALGDFVLTTGNITGVVDGETLVGAAASDTLSVIGAPALTLSLSSGNALPGDTVTATFTLNYSANASADATELGFSVDLDAALTGLIATNATQNDVCGTGSSISGSSVLTFAGGELSAGDTCSFSVVLQIPNSASGGTVSITTSAVAGTVSGVAVSNAAVSNNILISGITATKVFVTNPVLPGSETVLRYTLSNSANAAAATAISFSDSLTSVISSMSATSLPSSPCGISSNISGTTNLFFSGGELLPGASCSFDVPISVPSGATTGVYNSTSSAISATVDSVNVSAGEMNSVLSVEELTVNITTSASNPTSTNPIPVAINFSRDVVNFDASDLVIANGSVTNFVGSDNAFSAEITPTADGEVTVDLPINSVDDAIDNTVKNPAATQLTVIYESTPTIADPSISISSPSDTGAASGPITYTVTYTDVTQVNLTDAAVTLNKTGDANATAVVTNGDSTTATITLSNITGDGTLGVSIGSNTARNSTKLAGGAGPSTTFVVDNTQPTVAITSSLTGSVFNQSSFTATFTFSESVTDFDAADITAVNAAVSGFSAISSTVYSATITPENEGAVTIDVLAGVALDAIGNGNLGASQFQANYDVTTPTVSITSDIIGASTNSAFVATFTFSEDVTGFAVGDIGVANATLSNFAATNASVYTATVTPLSDGAVTLDIASDIAQDTATNNNAAATQFTTTYDATSPTVAISSTISGGVTNSAFVATFTFSEDVTGFVTSDITANNATIGTLSAISGSVYTATITPVSDGAVSINIPANVAQDAAGNVNTAAPSFATSFDATAPSVAITSNATGSVINNAFTATFTFSESVTGFTASDVIAMNATVGAMSSSSGAIYTAVVTPTSDGTVTLDVAANAAQDAAGNNNGAAPTFTTTFDATPPSVVITSNVAGSTTNSAFTATFTFSESVTGFALADITASNASVSNVTAVSSSVYTATITPANDGVVTLDIAAGVAQDSAGNNNTSAAQFTTTYDATSPTVAISSTISGGVTNSAFVATFTFSEDVTGFVTSDITANNATVGTLSTISGSVYTATITPVSDGAVSINIPANVAQDAAGNVNTAAPSFATSFDATAPSVAITSNATGSVINNAFTATFTFSESVTGFTASDVIAMNATVGAMSSSSGAIYTAVVTPTSDGTVTLDVAANAAQDAAGNNNGAAPTFTTTFDATPPSVVITSNVAGSTTNSAFTATFTFSESVTGFALADITASNASVSNVTAVSSSVYTATITPANDGAVTIDVPANAAQDSAGNSSTVASQFSTIYDASAPSIVITSDITGAITNSAFTATFTFSEDVTGFALNDITVANATASALSSSNNAVYTATITPVSDGAVTVDVAANVAEDTAGNANTSATQFTTTYDVSSPSLTITSDITDSLTNSAFIATFTFSEEVTGFTLGDINATNATVSSLTPTSMSVYTATITPLSDGSVTVSVAANIAQDVAGNGNDAATTFSVIYDTTSPQLLNSSPSNEEVDVAIARLAVTLNFSETILVNSGSIDLVKLSDSTVVETLSLLGDSVTREPTTITAQFAANLEQNEIYTVVISAGNISDAAGNSWQGLASSDLSFTAVNEPPGSNDDVAVVDEDDAVVIAVLANDEDLSDGVNPSSVKVEMQPLHATANVNTDTGEITYTPEINFNGMDSFTYTVEDNQGSVSAPATVTITVNPINDIPIAVDDNASTGEDQSLVISILDNDDDVDALSNLQPNTLDPESITIETDVNSGALEIVGAAAASADSTLQVGQVIYTPNTNFFGTDVFTYTVRDTEGATSTVATVTISVGAINDNPVASDDSANTTEDEAVAISVTANDSDTENELDIQSVTIEAQGTLGVASVDNNTGVITYTPNANRFGTDSFQYSVQDQQGLGSNIATVIVTITSVNDAPVTLDDTYTLATRVPTALAVLDNDSDPDSEFEPDNEINAASVSVVSAPSLGTVSVNGVSGVITYTPNEDVTVASDSFTYNVTDQLGSISNTATVQIGLQLQSIRLVAKDDTAEAAEDTPIIINILANDGDETRTLDIASVNITQLPTNGSVQKNNDGSVTYNPSSNFFGNDGFSYTVSDIDGDVSNVARVNINVSGVNDAPIISGSPALSVIAGQEYRFVPSVTDIDSSSFIFSVDNAPSWAAFDTSTGTLSGSTSESDAGNYTDIVISVNDDAGATANLSPFSIEVVSTASLTPTVRNISQNTAEDESVTFSVAGTDPNNLPLTYQLVQQPQSGTLSGALPLLTYTPDENFFGSDTFTYTASNNDYTSQPATVSITVTAVNDAPEATDDVATVVQGQEIVIDVLANDSDIESSALTITSAQAAQGMATIVDNKVAYLAEANTTGTVIVDYTVSDEGGLSSSAKVVVTVTAEEGRVPSVNLEVPEDITLNATGLITRVDLGQAIATDALGNPVATRLKTPPFFKPGKHTVVWEADAQGDVQQGSQLVSVNPIVSIDKAQRVKEGSRATIKVFLNGVAPTYPVNIPYSVSGTSNSDDHNLVDGTLVIESGTQASIAFDIANDGTIEGEETVIVSIAGATNVRNSEHILTIVEGGLRPVLRLTATQNNTAVTTIYPQASTVDVTLSFENKALSDIVFVDWSESSSELNALNISSSDTIFRFSPESLDAGVYHVKAKATDIDGLEGFTDITLLLASSLPTLTDEDSDGDGIPDNQEGLGDKDGDGIPDYLDATDECNVQPISNNNVSNLLVEGEVGACFKLGATAIVNSGAINIDKTIITPDTETTLVGPVFDFVVAGLRDVGQSYRIVLPQQNIIPAGAIYRKYSASEARWKDFEINGTTDAVHSAKGEQGVCPPPESEAYVAGLTEGHWCLQLTISDGGPNDEDGIANGTIVDPSALAVAASNNRRPVANNDDIALSSDSDNRLEVLLNDTDPDNDELTLLSANAFLGAIEIVSNELVYVKPDAFSGVDTVLYAISDGKGGSAFATATLNVDVNNAPQAQDDTAQTNNRTAVNIDVLANDTDADGDALSLVSVAVDAGQVAIIDNTISYTPNVGFVGSATISYRIKDTKEAIGEANVIVSVSERLNQAPIAQSDSAETTIGTPIIVDVIANDTDIDGDVLTVVSVSATQGEATIENNKVQFTPPNEFVGSVLVTYSVSDGTNEAEGRLFIRVIKPFKSEGGAFSVLLTLLLVLVLVCRLFLNKNMKMSSQSRTNSE